MSQKKLQADLKKTTWYLDLSDDCIKLKVDGSTIEAELDDKKVSAAAASFAAEIISEALYEVGAHVTERGVVLSWYCDSAEMRRTVPWAEAACLNPEKDGNMFISDSAGHIKIAEKFEKMARRLRHLAKTADL